METPRTLQAAIEYFADADRAHDYMVLKRWPNGVACPTCGQLEPRYLAKRRIFECKSKHERRQFSVKVGTIFEDSPIALKSWLLAVWMVANCKNGVSSYEVARAIGVTQKSAWFMLHRIRLAMQSPDGGKFNERKAGEKGSRVRTVVVRGSKKHDLLPSVYANIEPGANVFTDALQSYRGLGDFFLHQFVDHATTYVNGQVHTNGIENYWALLKRMLKGTYISVEPFHLFRYLDEQAFRFNERKQNDAERFESTLSTVADRRLTLRS